MPRSVFYDFPSAGGTAPAPRWGHAAAAVGECLYVFGGVGATVYDDAFCYDAVRGSWRAAVPAGGSRKEARPCIAELASAVPRLYRSARATELARGVLDAGGNQLTPGVARASDLTGRPCVCCRRRRRCLALRRRRSGSTWCSSVGGRGASTCGAPTCWTQVCAVRAVINAHCTKVCIGMQNGMQGSRHFMQRGLLRSVSGCVYCIML